MVIKKLSGFTLIEILVALSLIMFLSSIVMSSINEVRKTARDTKRVLDLEQFSVALNQYYINNRVFPCGDNWEEDPAFPGDITKGVWIDGSTSCPFLDGLDLPTTLCNNASPHQDYSVATGNGACKDPIGGTYRDGTYPVFSPKDPINIIGKNWYTYVASMDRQRFILRARLEDNPEMMENDGGMCDNIYEIGNGINDPYIASIWGC